MLKLKVRQTVGRAYTLAENVFPFGKPSPSDPTRPVTTLKTSWNTVRSKAMVKGRWHDNRHTLITELAESGAGDQTIMDIPGHVSKQMLKHYSHNHMEAKRSALEAIVNRRPSKTGPDQEEQTAAAPKNWSHLLGQITRVKAQAGTGQRGRMK